MALAFGLVLWAAAPVAAVNDGKLVLEPRHGQADAEFKATFLVGQQECPPETVEFFWHGKLSLGKATLERDCTATVTATPPPEANSVGEHPVTAGFCIGDDCHSAGPVDYVIDEPTPTDEPTPAPPTPTDEPPPPPPPPAPPTPPRPSVEPTAEPPTAPPSEGHTTPSPTVKPPVTPGPTPEPIATPSPTPEPTPSPSPNPSPMPTLTPDVTPTPTPVETGEVKGGATFVPPDGGSDPDGSDGGGLDIDAIAAAFDDVPLPALAADVPGPAAVSTDLDVLGTNLSLTVVVLLVFGITSSLFNSTIKSNRADIDAWVAAAGERTRPFAAPLTALGTAAGRLPGQHVVGRPVRVAVVLGLTGLVYGFLSPDFGLDAQSVVLFGSIVLGIGAVTYLSEGGGAFVASRRLHAPASVRLYVAAVAIAVVCVALSRLMDFRPGILYGFVASNLIVASVVLDRRQSAQLVILPTLALLAVSLLAWLALPMLRPAAEADGDWRLVLLDTVLVTIFVAGLEGVFYAMIPITFMDGAAVLEWNKVAWALLFGVATFLFWHLLLNQNDSYLDAMRQTRVVTALGLVVVYGLLTGGTWAFFKLRQHASGSVSAVA